MAASIQEFHYSGSEPKVTMDISGHFTEVAEAAHSQATVFLRDFRWRFTEISYTPPASDHFGSEGLFHIVASSVEE
jgi:hypothetical protein